jgi:dynein heavy chain
MSTNPHPKFPISVLQNSLRVTTEPPKGLRANMSRLYNNMPDDKFNNVKFKSENGKYKKLVFALSWFHSIIIERNKFKSLGWNLKYDFNDSDWITSDNILQLCLDSNMDKTQDGNRPVQWDMIKYLISEVLYGGRVTDDMDRRLLNVYANQYFNDKVISDEKYVLSDPTLPYVIPDELPSKD